MRQFIRENWFKVAILAVILVAILGYFSMEREKQQRELLDSQSKDFQKAVEERADEQEKAVEKNAIEQEKQTNAILLNQCLSNAELTYSANWKANCEDVAQINEKYCNSCLARIKSSYDSCMNSVYDKSKCSIFQNTSQCNSYCEGKQYNPNCSLPSTRAEALNKLLKDEKDNCFRQYQ